MGVVLDSSVVIDAEREHLNVADFLKKIAARVGEREACLCVITVAGWRTAFIAPTLQNGGNGDGCFWTS